MVEFAYNNDYQESPRMSLLEALYERSCNILISWSDLVNKVLIRLDILVYMEHEMKVIKKNLKVEQDRKKHYSNQHREFKEIKVGENLYLCMKPKNISLRMGSCTELEPRYCKPFEILERIGTVTYNLALPLIVKFHDFSHVSLLKIYVKDVDHVID